MPDEKGKKIIKINDFDNFGTPRNCGDQSEKEHIQKESKAKLPPEQFLDASSSNIGPKESGRTPRLYLMEKHPKVLLEVAFGLILTLFYFFWCSLLPTASGIFGNSWYPSFWVFCLHFPSDIWKLLKSIILTIVAISRFHGVELVGTLQHLPVCLLGDRVGSESKRTCT